MNSFLVLIVLASVGVGGFAAATTVLVGITRFDAVAAISLGAAIAFAVFGVCWISVRRAHSAELP